MEKTTAIPLRHCVQQALEKYFAHLDGHKPANLYAMVLKETEIPLIKATLKHANNNQTIAADILGISRGTLRKKIANLKIHIEA